MGNNFVPKFIFRLSRFPVYRGSVLGRFYCISVDISISIDQYWSTVVLIYTTGMTLLKKDHLTDGYFCLTKLDGHN